MGDQQLIADRYSLEELVGSGGAAHVYRATDSVEGGATVAVKVLKEDRDSDPAGYRRFEREAQDATLLAEHPNVVKVMDYGDYDGHGFMVMEWIAGEDLDAKLKRDGVPSWERACTLAVAAADALGAAHDLGIVHRDVKPANILIDDADKVHLTDFGLALNRQESVRLTTQGTFVGTAAYASPEQLRAGDPDARSDVYGLGATLYALLTGSPPFVAAGIPELSTEVQKRRPTRPSHQRPGLPHDLDAVVLKALQKDRDRRYQSMRAFREDLQRVLDHAQPAATDHAHVRSPLASIGRIVETIRQRDPAHKAVLRVVRLLLMMAIAFLVILAVFDLRPAVAAADAAGFIALAGFRGSRRHKFVASSLLLLAVIAFGWMWIRLQSIAPDATLPLGQPVALALMLIAVYVVGLDRGWGRIPILLLLAFAATSIVAVGGDDPRWQMAIGTVFGAAVGVVVPLVWPIGASVLSDRAHGPLRKLTTSDLIDRLGTLDKLECLTAVQWDDTLGPNAVSEARFVRTVAGMMNASGGTVLIGVSNDGDLVGVDHDRESTHARSQISFKHWIVDLIETTLGAEAATRLAVSFDAIDRISICRVDVVPAAEPVFSKTRSEGETFDVRFGSTTRSLPVSEAAGYISSRWD